MMSSLRVKCGSWCTLTSSEMSPWRSKNMPPASIDRDSSVSHTRFHVCTAILSAAFENTGEMYRYFSRKVFGLRSYCRQMVR